MTGVIMRNERRDELLAGGLGILQLPEVAFSLDAVLLANFVTIRPGDRVLDLGTGTGVVALLLAAKTQAERIVGLEILPEVAAVARRNVVDNDLDGRIEIVQGDLRQAAELFPPGSFDVVAANPPYFPVGSGRLSPEPTRAAARHELLCTLADVVAAARAVLTPEGRFSLVLRARRLPELRTHLAREGFAAQRLRMVHPREGAPAQLALIEAGAGTTPECPLLPPLVVRADDGSYIGPLQRVFDGSARLDDTPSERQGGEET